MKKPTYPTAIHVERQSLITEKLREAIETVQRDGTRNLVLLLPVIGDREQFVLVARTRPFSKERFNQGGLRVRCWWRRKDGREVARVRYFGPKERVEHLLDGALRIVTAMRGDLTLEQQ